MVKMNYSNIHTALTFLNSTCSFLMQNNSSKFFSKKTITVQIVLNIKIPIIIYDLYSFTKWNSFKGLLVALVNKLIKWSGVSQVLYCFICTILLLS